MRGYFKAYKLAQNMTVAAALYLAVWETAAAAAAALGGCAGVIEARVFALTRLACRCGLCAVYGFCGCDFGFIPRKKVRTQRRGLGEICYEIFRAKTFSNQVKL